MPRPLRARRSHLLTVSLRHPRRSPKDWHSKAKMPLFMCQWKLKDAMASNALTMFASMDEKMDAADAGDNKMIGRWSNLADKTGTLICESPDVTAFMKWMFNWSEDACDAVVKPVINDDDCREIVLAKSGGKPTWKTDYYVKYGDKGYEAEAGESLFTINFTFKSGADFMTGINLFAGLTKEQDAADCGKVIPMGRYFNLGEGSGFVICKLPAGATEADLYKWAFNWAAICECKITPALTDKACRAVVQGKKGFAEKQKAVMAAMA